MKREVTQFCVFVVVFGLAASIAQWVGFNDLLTGTIATVIALRTVDNV